MRLPGWMRSSQPRRARLSGHPFLGETGHIPCTRELLPHENYRLVYEIEQETIWVLAMVHAARRWPPVNE
jgi:toxin ParE1/3/4